MTIDLSSFTGKTQERTYRIEVNIPYEGDAFLRAYREIIVIDDKGTLLGRQEGDVVDRVFSDISALSFPLADGTTLTGQQFSDAIDGVTDQLRQTDIAAASAALASPATPAVPVTP